MAPVCGIAAVLLTGQPGAADAGAAAVDACRRMVATLHHRGPDEQHVVAFGPCLLGHARLSIIDLATGSQPISNEDGSISVVFNGEIYNYVELRDQLAARGHVFQTQSDTEVIPHLYEEYGDDFPQHLNGMFAIALWDARRQRLVAARDRMGEKPLLYAATPAGFALASELRAFRELNWLTRSIDTGAIGLFFSSMYVPAPHTIFREVKKLPPAHLMVVDVDGIQIRPYWTPAITIDESCRDEEWVSRLEDLFADSVARRLIADVPLGVFLSGGIDSSAVTAFAAQASTAPIHTYTVEFVGDIDERPWARQVAQRYGTDHHEIVIESRVDDEVEAVLTHMDEPFGDSSLVPTKIVSRAAREHVKVILGGDGGDELFGGYSMYLDQRLQRGSRLATAGARAYQRLGLGDPPPYRGAMTRPYDKWHHARSVTHQDELAALLTFDPPDAAQFFRRERWLRLSEPDPLSVAFNYDLNYYLPDDLLKKVDMASMMASIETRAPFLDHRFVELCLSIPTERKLRGGMLKRMLKQLLVPHLPHDLLHRPKQGFGAPVGAWLRQRLQPLVRDLLAPGCRSQQFVQRAWIDRSLSDVYNAAPSAEYRVDYRLWMLLVFELWLRRWA